MVTVKQLEKRYKIFKISLKSSLKAVGNTRELMLKFLQTLLGFRPACLLKINKPRASLVAQWLRIHLPMQGTRVRALVREDPTCRGATKPVCHNY